MKTTWMRNGNKHIGIIIMITYYLLLLTLYLLRVDFLLGRPICVEFIHGDCNKYIRTNHIFDKNWISFSKQQGDQTNTIFNDNDF